MGIDFDDFASRTKREKKSGGPITIPLTDELAELRSAMRAEYDGAVFQEINRVALKQFWTKALAAVRKRQGFAKDGDLT